ncbi:MAG: PAS domain S-box protein, partial [Bryobacteraceae bacterium]|nr:PAS domain S-box protein [Bryobacteraceae bacterium]
MVKSEQYFVSRAAEFMDFEEINVLLVEDNPADARLLREAVREVEGNHIHLTHVDNLAKALTKLDQSHFDVVMLDLSLPDAEGLATLVTTHNRAPSVPIVVLTGRDDEELAIRAVREGAQDYLVKGQVTGQLLVRAMRYATERKRAIEALQRSEEYFRSLIENALDIITVLDVEGFVRYGSPSFERVLGYQQSALTGSNAFDLVHPEDGKRVREMLETGSRHPGATQHFECRFRHRNGTWRVFEAIGKRFEAESSVNGYVLNSRDITERKRSEEQLRQANDTLRAVIEASPLAIYALDLNGNVRSWNAAAQQMFGYPTDEVMYSKLPICVAEEEAAFRLCLKDAARGKLAAGVEEKACRKDGSSIDVSIWNSILRDEWGAVEGIVEAVADNTERKRLEEQFRQAQKMEAVGRLAGGVAHDFNNLLTVITGYCQMLVDRIGPSHEMSEDLQQVLKAADRATVLTRQLLAFSRRQIVQPKVVDPMALIEDMRPMLQRLLGEDVKLIIRSQEEGARIRVDPGNLGQVMVNM